jgi:arylsulfatase A-like enzyme
VRTTLPLLLGLAAFLPGCSPDSPDRQNVLLVAIDTLRWDHLGCYGASRPVSPALDALAAEGTRFEHAYATAPWTTPSVATLHTGLMPSAHGLTRPKQGLSEELETLAEILRAAGWSTTGVVSNPHLRSKYGFEQGFDSWIDVDAKDHRHVSTQGVTRSVVDALRGYAESAEPFFLFALYFDPHYSYVRHPQFGFAKGPSGRLVGGESIAKLRGMSEDITAEEVDFLKAVYDEEIRFTDQGIKRVLTALEEFGLAEDTVVAVVGDHGEEFFEREWLGHARTLYEELVRVPFLLRAPGAAPRVVEEPTSLLSVAPTLLDLVGIRPENHRMEGRSLAPWVLGGATEVDAVHVEVDFVPVSSANAAKEAHKRAIRRDTYKLIVDDVTGERELYDLASDPLELTDVSEDNPELVESLFRDIERRTQASLDFAVAARNIEMTGAELEVLRNLGYADE